MPESPASTPRSIGRRRFLRGSLFLGGSAIVGWSRLRQPQSHLFRDLQNLKPWSAVILVSVLRTLLPPSAPQTPEALLKYIRAIDRYLTGMEPWDILQVNALLLGVDQAPLLFQWQWSRFSRSTKQQCSRALKDWQTSSLGLRRLAYRTLKTMAFLAYYQTDEAFQTIGYSGPLFRNFQGLPHSRARYDSLLAPASTTPKSKTPKSTIPKSKDP